MKKIRKQLTIITLTLAFILIFSGAASAAEWTVGPDGTYNYQSIQGAVDGSSENDTITVSPNGTDAYTENVVVNKTGLLIKANGLVTVQPQNPANPVFTIDQLGNNSTIQGFTIRSGGYDNSYYGIGMVETSGCKIIGNNILNANQAIYADRCSDVTIDGNTISNSYSVGIHLYNSLGSSNKALNNILIGNREGIEWYATNNGEISGNIIQNSGLVGIFLHNSLNNLISGNTVTGTQIAPGTYYCNGDGIYLETVSSNNVISGNTISNNANNGIHLWYACNSNTINENNIITSNGNGIYLEQAFGVGNSINTIAGNTINNNVNGINLYGSGSNTISGNNVSDNSNVGIFLQEYSSWNNVINNIANRNVHGIYLNRFCDYNTIEENTADYNDETGITIGASTLNTIKNNIISNNGFISGEQRYGIWSNYYGNTITGNTIINNFNGIGLRNYVSNDQSETINYNRIFNNTNWNLNNLNTNGIPDATYNWWGINSQSAIASKINGTATYSPWLFMTLNATPNPINNGATSLITVSFNNYSSDGINFTPFDPATGHIPDGTPVAFSAERSIDGSSTTSGGVATATLTADGAPGEADINAVTDAQTVNTSVLINSKSSLYLTITPSKTNPVAGDTVVYTLKVGNNGPDAAENVVMTYVIPEGLEFVTADDDTGNTWTYDENTRTITWNLGTIPKGDPNLWLTLHVAQAGQYLINPALSTSTYDPTLESSIQSITVNAAAAQSNDDEPTGTTVNAQTTTETVEMQETGIPISMMVLAILMVLGGLFRAKRE